VTGRWDSDETHAPHHTEENEVSDQATKMSGLMQIYMYIWIDMRSCCQREKSAAANLTDSSRLENDNKSNRDPVKYQQKPPGEKNKTFETSKIVR
jgi:hypothetical protein